MPETRDSLSYQRTVFGSERAVTLYAITDPSVISVSVVRGDDIAYRTQTEGRHGADLLVALSSAYTAATQGMEAHVKAGDLVITARKNKKGEWWLSIDSPNSGVSIPLDMGERVILSLQTLLNDVTGEYRRQISEYEKAAS